MNDLEKVAKAIGLKIQLRDFGHDEACDDGVGFLTTAKKIDELDKACAEAARAALEALMETVSEDAHKEAYGKFLLAKEGLGFSKSTEHYWQSRLRHILEEGK